MQDNARDYLEAHGITPEEIAANEARNDQADAWVRSTAPHAYEAWEAAKQGDYRTCEHHAAHISARILELGIPAESKAGVVIHTLLSYGAQMAGPRPDQAIGDLLDERSRQDAKWGEQNHNDGTGPDERPVPMGIEGLSAERLAEWAKDITDIRAREGELTWRHILLEEVLEAFAESEPSRLRVELIQVAAVAVQWAEAIDRRTAPAV